MDPRSYGYVYHYSEEDHKIPGIRNNRELFSSPNSSRLDMAFIDALRDQFEATSFACPSSSFSLDGTNSETLSLSFDPSEHGHGDDDGSSSTDGSSPLGWPPSRRTDHCPCPPTKQFCGPGTTVDTTDKKDKELSGGNDERKVCKATVREDMSGGGKGVSSALAISNAITNLAASVFGEIWRLEPLSLERKSMWKREMEWLLSVADHIVELVPSVQTFPDGTKFEVMITRPRADLHVNLPALRKLDTMLLESLDNFSEAEFWYIDNGVTDDDNNGLQRLSIQRNEEKWWLPVAKVPSNGLSEIERKRIQHQKDCIAQILKAALAINSQVLSEMEIPDVYWNALPKNGKSSLGEALYKIVTSESFSPEAFLSACDLSNEHKTVDLANRLEAAVHVWRRRRPAQGTQKATKESRLHGKSSWGMVKDFVSDAERREFLADRVEGALLCLRQKFPNLRQSLLDMTKIQYNKDIGQSILESYSRVLESLASNIVSRIDDVLYVDEITRRHGLPEPPRPVKTHALSQRRGYSMNFSLNHSLYGTPFGTPSVSPTPSPSPRRTPNSPLNSGQNGPSFSDFICYSYETEPDNYQAYKKLPPGHVSTLSSRSLNSNRSQSIYPMHDL